MPSTKSNVTDVEQKQLRGAVRKALRAQLTRWAAEADIEAILGTEIDDLGERISDFCTALGDSVPKSAVDELIEELIEAASEQRE